MRLDRRKFEAWLKAKSPTEIVGVNRDCHSCPIAHFYHDATGGHEIVIFIDGWGNYCIDRGYSKREAPSWAVAFMFDVDGEEVGKISAGRALEILSQIDC